MSKESIIKILCPSYEIVLADGEMEEENNEEAEEIEIQKTEASAHEDQTKEKQTLPPRYTICEQELVVSMKPIVPITPANAKNEEPSGAPMTELESEYETTQTTQQKLILEQDISSSVDLHEETREDSDIMTPITGEPVEGISDISLEENMQGSSILEV